VGKPRGENCRKIRGKCRRLPLGNLTEEYRWKRQRSKVDKWQMQNSWKARKLCSFPDAEKNKGISVRRDGWTDGQIESCR